MKNSEIRELTTQELEGKIEETKNNLMRMRLNHAVSPLENPMLIQKTRKEIARLKTELHRRTLNQ